MVVILNSFQSKQLGNELVNIDREQVGVIREEMNVTSSDPEVFVSITDTKPRYTTLWGENDISQSRSVYNSAHHKKKIKVLFRPPLIKRFDCPQPYII